jgi:hypothetical protein
MNRKLVTDNYIIIENFIDPERAKSLFKEFQLCDSKFKFEGDPQAPNSASVYNYLPALELLCEKTKEISEYVEEIVLPTYTYSRIYKTGSELLKHTDRHACEISVTLHLNGDKLWPIWICTPEEKVRCVTLQPGDAMIYLGCVAEHWRGEYGGEEYGQFFLHYVRSRGPCAYTYFDKQANIETDIKKDEIYQSLLNNYNEYKEPQTTQIDDDNPIIIPGDSEMKIKNINEYLKDKIGVDPIIETEDKKIQNSNSNISKTKLEDYILHLDSFVSPDLCDKILQEYSSTDLWDYAQTGSGIDIRSRNCSVIGISEPDIINQNQDVRKQLDEELYFAVASALKEYEQNFPYLELEIKEDSGYELLKYEPGGYYIQHTDSFKESPRAISCSINLNDDYEGGQFAFFNREVVYELKKGSIILFPSSFMYPHEVMPVNNGTRYSIITWLV